MILRESWIDGYGLHRGLRLRWGSGLNLVLGDNEAGKSTLHSFLRQMLYGFPDGRSKEPRYLPLRGGEYGGSLLVEVEESRELPGGEWRIERYGKRLVVELPGGRRGGQQELDLLLRGTNAQLFRDVFAFGLDELAGLGGLTDSELELRIFDASLTGASRSVTSLVAELEKARREELSPRKGRIRELVSSLGELEAQRKEAHSKLRGYRSMLRAEAQAEGDLVGKRAQREEAAREIARWEAILGAWPYEVRRREARDELSLLREREEPRPDERLHEAEEEARLLIELGARLDAAEDGLREAEQEELGAAHALLRIEGALGERQGRVAGEGRGTELAIAPGRRFGPIVLVILGAASGSLALHGASGGGGGPVFFWAGALALTLTLLVAAWMVWARPQKEESSRLDGGVATAARREDLLREQREVEASRSLVSLRRSRLEGEVQALLGRGGVSSKEELEERTSRARRRQVALRQLEEAQSGILERLGAGERGQAALLELESGERDRWELSLAEAKRRLVEAEGEVEDLVRQLALRRHAREELERSAALQEIEAEIGRARAELEEAAHRWREAALVEKLLIQSLEELREARQPEVLRFAGEAFTRITGGRYRAIRQAAGVGGGLVGEGLELVDLEDRRLVPGALSRGTREQLYFCLRLGLAAAFARQGVRLPLLLDDVLVDFDPNRVRAVSEVLADFAKEHQLVLFTCHPSTIELLVRTSPEAAVLKLEPPARENVAELRSWG